MEKRESSTPDTADWLCPVALAMLATSSVLVMDLSAMWFVLQTTTRVASRYADGEEILPVGRETASTVSTEPRNYADLDGFRAFLDGVSRCGRGRRGA
ncbi:hypothetical protein CHE218_22050 [Microbacterium sp. che218]